MATKFKELNFQTHFLCVCSASSDKINFRSLVWPLGHLFNEQIILCLRLLYALEILKLV